LLQGVYMWNEVFFNIDTTVISANHNSERLPFVLDVIYVRPKLRTVKHKQMVLCSCDRAS
jgi:hypothetical protein